MAIQKLSEDILLVELPSAGSKIADELKTVNEMVCDECSYDVIIDFFKVELFNSWNISNLLALRQLLNDAGYHLVLYNVRVVTKCIFTVAGLRKVFVFADNRESALAELPNYTSPSGINDSLP
jgi:anti-anti-sigma regulatory factor